MCAYAYPEDALTAAEAELLSPHVTNTSLPVFALTNLPETTKGMLFARYSRYAGTLRRLMVDEFSDSLQSRVITEGEGEHAAAVAERVIGQFGDDSVMQLAGVHVACEWVSNIMTKVLQRPRVGAAYLEQSTRYIAYDRPVAQTSQYRFYDDPELGPLYRQQMETIFQIYSDLVASMIEYNATRFPRSDQEPQIAWERAIRAKALDACRGLLPAGTLSHMGIYASAQPMRV
jgi:thymidylate synthase ThyX